MNPSRNCCWMAVAVALIGGCSESTATKKSDSGASHSNAVANGDASGRKPFIAAGKYDPYDPARDAMNDYDPARDAVNDFATVIEMAGKSKKRILIEIGGKW